MEDLTPQQQKRFDRLAKLADKGLLAIVEHLFDLEETFDEKIGKVTSSIPDLETVAEKIRGEDGLDGDDGKDGRDGVDGRDGKDGINGVNGRDGKDGRDGRNGIDGKDGLNGKDGKDGKDGSPDMAEDIRNKLELLEGDERLDRKAIKGLEDIEDFKKNVTKDIFTLSQRPLSSGNIEVYQDGTKIGSSQRLRFSGATVTNDSDGAVKVTVGGSARLWPFKVDSPSMTLVTGDGQAFDYADPLFNGWRITSATAAVTTVSSSGAITIQMRNATQGVDLFSTALTIDANEKNSSTATTPVVINTSNNTLTSYDEWFVDIDDDGTGARGLTIHLTIEPA